MAPWMTDILYFLRHVKLTHLWITDGLSLVNKLNLKNLGL